MNKLSVSGLGFGLGFASVLLYLLCVIFMDFAPREAEVFIFNSLLHGLDISTIARSEVSGLETVFGVIFTFVLGWLFGAIIAWIYNRISVKTNR